MKTPKIITILMLIIAVGNRPYNYYKILRWVVSGVSVFSAYNSHREQSHSWTWIYVSIAILFNPIAPIFLDKETWILIDIIVAVIFLISIFKKETVSTS